MRPLLLLPVLAVALLAGCGGDPDPGAAPVTVTATVTSTPEPTTTPRDVGRTPGTTAPSAAVPTRTGATYAAFVTPSGNIGCALYRDDEQVPATASCGIMSAQWAGVPDPGDCELEWVATDVGLDPDGTVTQGGCRGDLSFDPSAEVLPYGEAIAVGEIVCRSAESGVSCEHLPSGNGFTLSRAALTTS